MSISWEFLVYLLHGFSACPMQANQSITLAECAEFHVGMRFKNMYATHNGFKLIIVSAKILKLSGALREHFYKWGL